MIAEICQHERRSSNEGKLGKLTFRLYAKVRGKKVSIILHDVIQFREKSRTAPLLGQRELSTELPRGIPNARLQRH
jgi:hypothetical protein